MKFIYYYRYWDIILQINSILFILFIILTHRGVNPEAEPGHDDEHAGGNIDSEQVVRELSLQGQLHLQAAVLACNHRVHIFLEMKQGQCVCPLSWSVHCNFTGEGKCNEKGWACTPHPHQPGQILPSWLNVSQKAAVATLCTLCLQQTKRVKGTQEWEIFWLLFWILYYFIVSYS